MDGRPAPQVYLKEGGNPWSDTLSDAVVQRMLLNAAMRGEELIVKWIGIKEAEGDATFAQVYLDPTRPRHQRTIKQRIFAFVLYGDPTEAFNCLPNAAAKADAADRLGRPNGEFVAWANFCLGNGDFAWGDSAAYKEAISAGSGLTSAQDRALAQLTLETTMNAVHDIRLRWIADRRRHGSQGWYNGDNLPGEEYLFEIKSGEWLTPPRS